MKKKFLTFIDQSVSIEDYSQNEVLEIPRSYIHNGKEIIVEHVEAISSYASKIIVSDTIKSFNAQIIIPSAMLLLSSEHLLAVILIMASPSFNVSIRTPAFSASCAATSAT